MDNKIIRYSIDKIENNLVEMQNLDTLEMIIVSKYDINFDVNESDIILFDGKNYIKDEKTTKSRIDYIREKMNKLKQE